jgi:cysteinyl-tRNA synthetase
MNDDFNTPDAITALFELVSEANSTMQRHNATAGELSALLALIEQFDTTLGLLPSTDAADELLDEQIENLIIERTEARKSKNWARADEIRDILAADNIVLEDTPQGIKWRRK